LRRFLIPLVFGLAGAAVLISLGVWQVQRLGWKQAILADIQIRIAEDPVPIPENVDSVRDRYLPVTMTGASIGPELHVLMSTKELGAGYRVIQAVETQGRRVLADLGYIPLTAKDSPRAQVHKTFVGNLHWPEETDSYTPDPDVAKNIWFARDVARMSGHLNTEPILVIVRETSQSVAKLTPLPVDSTGIPNDHLQYAITWFSLAAIWLIMTGYFLSRTAKAAKGNVT